MPHATENDKTEPNRKGIIVRRGLIIGLTLIALMLLVSLAAASHGGYHVDWWTADGGGGLSSGEGYTLQGTAGQPDAGVMTSDDGSYTLAGGFWGGAAGHEPDGDVYLPLVQD